MEKSREGAVIELVEESVENEAKQIVYLEGFNGVNEYHKDELNQLIKKIFEFCNVNFFIGSGYCYEKLRTLGNLECLIEMNAIENKDNLSSKYAIEALILYDFFRNSIYPHKSNLENNISFEHSNQFILKLSGLLASRNDKNLLKRVNLFTTNYDMFFELSLETNNIYYNDGFSGRVAPKFSTLNYNRIVKQIVQNTERESQIPTINLYKLHGSLSWEKHHNKVLYRTNSSRILDEIEMKASVFTDNNFCYDKSFEPSIVASIETIKESNSEFDNELGRGIEEFFKSYNQLHIINPTKKKFEETLLSNIYYDLLRMYSNELEKNNSVLFVFGFSFKDEHIYNITKRALANPTMSMYIFIFTENELSNFKALFKEHNNVFYVYCKDKNIDLSELNSMMFGG